MSRVGSWVLAFGVTVMACGARPPDAPSAPSGGDPRNIARCGGNFDDDTYLVSQPFACEAVAQAYAQDGRVAEAMRLYETACDYADGTLREGEICNRWVGLARGYALEGRLDSTTLAHFRRRAPDLCVSKSSRMRGLCYEVGSFFEDVEPKDPVQAQRAYETECRATGTSADCDRAREHGSVISEEQRVRAMNASHERMMQAARERDEYQEAQAQLRASRRDPPPVGVDTTPAGSASSAGTPSGPSTQRRQAHFNTRPTMPACKCVGWCGDELARCKTGCGEEDPACVNVCERQAGLCVKSCPSGPVAPC
jgi:hypothetical protein